MRRILAAAALVIAPAAALATAVPASAGTMQPVPKQPVPQRVTHVGTLRALPPHTGHCSGSIEFSQQLRVKGRTVAELDVYPTPAHGGTITACMRHVGPTRGVRLLTSVAVGATPARRSTVYVSTATAGWDAQYSGPAAVAGVKGHCYTAAGAIMMNHRTYMVTIPLECIPAR